MVPQFYLAQFLYKFCPMSLCDSYMLKQDFWIEWES